VTKARRDGMRHAHIRRYPYSTSAVRFEFVRHLMRVMNG
jgi:hypothetical protein